MKLLARVSPMSQTMSQTIDVRKTSEADFPTAFGHFRILGFEGLDARGVREESVVLKMGDLSGSPPLVRIHSQCLTGDVFHSLRCDCGAQLELALRSIAAEGRGLLIYENQEGRGIGLLNKLRAYELQDGGADTVQANQQLGFEADLRGYELAGAILRHLGLSAVRLMSNNPEKIQALERAGVRVTERVPSIVPPLDSTEDYLRTKREKLGHLLD
jgi:GTP cyclohydrolase II